MARRIAHRAGRRARSTSARAGRGLALRSWRGETEERPHRRRQRRYRRRQGDQARHCGCIRRLWHHGRCGGRERGARAQVTRCQGGSRHHQAATPSTKCGTAAPVDRPTAAQGKPREGVPGGQVHVDQSPAECTGAGFVKKPPEGGSAALPRGLPKSAFLRVHRRRMPWARRGSPRSAFFIIAGFRAQGRLSQLSARS